MEIKKVAILRSFFINDSLIKTFSLECTLERRQPPYKESCYLIFCADTEAKKKKEKKNSTIESEIKFMAWR